MLRSQILDDVSSVRSDRWSADQDREYRAVKEGKFNRAERATAAEGRALMELRETR